MYLAYIAAGFACIAALHPVVNFVLTQRYVDFANHDQQLYIQKNVVKAAVLAVLTPITAPALYKALIYNIWDHHMVRYLSLAYGCCDAYALFRFYDILHPSTRFHHSIVTSFVLFNIFGSGDLEPWKHLNAFGALSTFTFPVNYYLAMRFLYKKEAKKRLASICKYIYMPTIGANCLYQANVLFHNFSLPYSVVVGMLLYDDYFLLRHLYRQS